MSDALKKLEFVDRAKNMVARWGVNRSTPAQIEEEDYSPMHPSCVRKVEMKTPSVVTLTQVVDCLKRQAIEYSEYFRDATEGNSITAIIRSSMSEKKASYSIVFKFDDHDCLVAYDVQAASEPL